MNCNINVELLPKAEELETLAQAETFCPVDWAKNVADIARMNNCGKSVMCRDGMNQLWTIINDITIGKAESTDMDLLTDLCNVIASCEGCEIACKAAEMIGKSISMYSEEWEAHIKRKRCTKRVCEVLAANMPVIPQRAVGEDGAPRRRRRKSAE